MQTNRYTTLFFFTFLAALTTALPGAAQSAQPKTTYQNPVIAGDFADPSVIRVGDTYYAVGTSSEWGPAFPIYASTDLVNWQYVGPVFAKLPDWIEGSYWAPELFHRNGLFYVYYTARRKSDAHSYIGVATSRDLRQGFTDRGLLLEWTSEAIDAFVIEDNHRLYLTWKAYGLDKGKATELLGAELSPDGLRVTGQAFTLLRADASTWEGGGAEGQALFKRGRYYYMTYSGNTCCGANCNYQVGLARAGSLRGPWEKFSGNPVLTSHDDWKCPGHGTVVTTPDKRYFYLHHAYKSDGFTFTGRQGVLTELVWNDQTGWPAFRYGTVTPAEAIAPTTHPQQLVNSITVNFGKTPATIPWVWDVHKSVPVYTIANGQLRLNNVPADLVGSFLGLVVKESSYTLSVGIHPQESLWQSIGLYGDARNALGVGVRGDSLELWQVRDGVRSQLQTQGLPSRSGPLTLRLTSRRGQFFTFGWITDGGAFQTLNSVEIDGSFLPRWDRAPRLGISVRGPDAGGSRIDSLSLVYE
ncbi:MAG: family 43 glycosylhydrolase [Spirosoma sp.]|nr:family 43 glycosylhydrolase [Spirosoma sp.]